MEAVTRALAARVREGLAAGGIDAARDPKAVRALIDRAIDSLCEGKTVLVVAHRLDAVDGCDAVAVMEDGRIACMGPHDAVLETSSYYRSAWTAWTRSRSMSYRIGEKEGRHVR